MSRGRRNLLLAVLAVAVVLAGGGAFGFRRLQDRCSTEDVLAKLGRLIPKDADKDGIAISNARLAPGQLLAFPYVCEAETQPLRLDLRPGSGENWQHILFRVAKGVAGSEIVLLDLH
jgi:hypothetical protein